MDSVGLTQPCRKGSAYRMDETHPSALGCVKKQTCDILAQTLLGTASKTYPLI